MHRFPGRAVLGASLCLALAACGGGSSSSKYDGSMLQGQVLMGYNTPLTGATICIYGVPNSGTLFTTAGLVVATAGAANPYYSGSVLYSDNGNSYTALTTAQAACTSTDGQGNFSVNLSSFYGPVIIQAAGGSYTSAVTHAATSLNNLTDRASSLEAVANIGGGGTVSTVVTPLTTIATEYASSVLSGVTSSTYATGLSHVQNQFKLSQSLTVAPSTGDAYDLALKGVQQYLSTNAAYPGNDPNGTQLMTWTNLGGVSALYTTAYQAINGGSATFTFN